MKLLLSILLMMFLSGCAFTKWINKDKVHETVDNIYDKPKEEAKPVVQEPVKPVDTDIALIKSFQWVDTGDGCESGTLEHGSIVKTYTGFVTNPFEVLAELPQDFTIGMGPGGVSLSIPKSDPTGNMSDMGDRRAFICLFDASKILIGTEDFNGPGLDNRWRDKDVAYAVVFHCINTRCVSRSQVIKTVLSKAPVSNPGNFQEASN